MSHIADLLIKLIADYLVIPIVLLAAWAFFALPARVRYRRIAWAVVMGLATLLVGKIASLFYQGQRPFEALHEAPKAAYLANHGFPSDHVLFVFAITFAVWAATKNPKLSGLLLAMSCLVAIGRILALVHTPLDVAGGIICALLAAVIVYGRHFFDRHLQD
jgi:membrane-associated phospholipid phosphatase